MGHCLDAFVSKLNLKKKPDTRRGFLSDLSPISDAIGYLQPYIVPVKKLMQKLCTLGIGKKTIRMGLFHQASESCCESDVSSIFEESSTSPKQFNQEELSDLKRDLNLCKEASEVLASRLEDKKCLSVGTKVTFYYTRESDLLPYYHSEEGTCFLLRC